MPRVAEANAVEFPPSLRFPSRRSGDTVVESVQPVLDDLCWVSDHYRRETMCLTYISFFVNLGNIPPVLRWLRYFSTLGFTLEALSVNEVGSGLMIVVSIMLRIANKC